MPKTVRDQIEQFYFHYPCAATIVTSHAGGKSNAMAVAWHAAMSHHPPLYMVSISPKRFTHQLITASGEFAVNFMPFEQGRVIAAVAGCSGRDVDKFGTFSIQAAPGARVRAPVLANALAAYECRVVERRTFGDHDLFVGEIVAVQYEPSAFNTDLQQAPQQRQPILYLGADCYFAGAGQPVHIERRSLAGTVAAPRANAPQL